MSLPGDNEQSCAALTSGELLDWQAELDSAMTELDTRLSHPRRRASDVAPEPMLPQLAQVGLTTELLDEIAWRVAQQIGRAQAAPPPPDDDQAPAAVTETPALPSGISIVIRLRKPLFSWRF